MIDREHTFVYKLQHSSPIAAIGSPQVATWAIFFIHGSVIGTWVANVPFVRSEVGISTATLGLCLLALGVGTVVMNLPVGRLLHHHPSAKIAQIGAVLVPIVAVLPFLARTPIQLAASLALLGMAFAVLDVSMNTHGVAIEKKLGSAIMSSLHGGWSVGLLIGAGAVAFGRLVGVPPRLEAASFFALLLGLALTVGRHLGEGETMTQAVGTNRPRVVDAIPSRTVLLIGFLVMALLTAEGAVNDWSALYVTEGLDGSGALGAVAVTAFSAGMAFGRIRGDSLNRRFGPHSLLARGAWWGVAALGVMVVIGSRDLVLPALFLAGLGMANGAPLLFSAAGNAGDMHTAAAVAATTMMANFGLLVAPPLLGLVAQHFGLSVVPAIACGLLAVVGIGTWRVAFAERQPESVPRSRHRG